MLVGWYLLILSPFYGKVCEITTDETCWMTRISETIPRLMLILMTLDVQQGHNV